MKLVVNALLMTKENQELLERCGKKHNNKHGPKAEIDLHEDDDVLQNEYDCDFWLKVSLIKCLKYFDHLTSW